MKTIENITLDYISKNSIPSYYVHGKDITPKLLKKYKVCLEEGETPLLMLRFFERLVLSEDSCLYGRQLSTHPDSTF